MQNTFIQTTGDQVIIDKSDLITYAIVAAVVVVLIIIVAIAMRMRKKNFIKTLPTNLKDEG